MNDWGRVLSEAGAVNFVGKKSPRLMVAVQESREVSIFQFLDSVTRRICLSCSVTRDKKNLPFMFCSPRPEVLDAMVAE